MSAFFAEYARIILFIHVLFAVTWIGGMVAIRFALHPSLVCDFVDGVDAKALVDELKNKNE